MNLSIVIPVHNEQDNIDPLFHRLRDTLNSLSIDYEIIFVNDGSSDQSGTILDGLAASEERVIAVHLARNFGQTPAIVAGFDHAIGDVIILMDGDNQNDPSDIPALLAKVDEGFDVVSGWRKHRRDRFLTRIVPSKAANWLISLLTGVHLHDYGCTLKAYRRQILTNVRLYGEMHRFIPIYAAGQGARVAEVVVSHNRRTAGGSHYGLSRVFGVTLDLLFLHFMARFGQRPIHMYGSFGILNIVAGLFVFGLMICYKFWGGKTFIETPLPTLAVMFLLVGVVALFFGFNAEILMRTYYESQQKKPYEIKSVVGKSSAV